MNSWLTYPHRVYPYRTYHYCTYRSRTYRSRTYPNRRYSYRAYSYHPYRCRTHRASPISHVTGSARGEASASLETPPGRDIRPATVRAEGSSVSVSTPLRQLVRLPGSKLTQSV